MYNNETLTSKTLTTRKHAQEARECREACNLTEKEHQSKRLERNRKITTAKQVQVATPVAYAILWLDDEECLTLQSFALLALV